jgi:DNA-binding beta-propeller fold protein YncE
VRAIAAVSPLRNTVNVDATIDIAAVHEWNSMSTGQRNTRHARVIRELSLTPSPQRADHRAADSSPARSSHSPSEILMSTHWSIAFSIPTLVALCSFTGDKPSAPVKEHEIALPGEGSWDYVTVDSAAGRVYVAHLTRIEVIDAKTNAVVGHVDGIDGAHGTAIVPELKRGFATSGKNNKLVVFDLESLKSTKEVETGVGPDATLYVSSVGEVWTMNHKGGTITCVDAKSLEVTKTIEVGGALEFAVEDPAKGLVFVNVEDKGLLVVVDAKKHEITAKHATAPGEEPAGLAIDRKNGLLFLGCGNKKLVVMQAATGKVVTALDIGEHCDGVAFDPDTGNVFASCRGASSVVHEKDASTFESIGSLEAGKTCAVDPKTHKLYITTGTRNEKDSVKLVVYAPKPGSS